jgi:hypothetical protein
VTLKRTLANPWLMASLSLVSGLLGGMGGRRLALLAIGAQLDELYDAIEALKLRMNRRDGLAGAAVKRTKREEESELQAELEEVVARRGARGEGPVPARTELAARAAAMSATKPQP